MDLYRVIRHRLFPVPFNVQRARTGAFILLLGLVCAGVSISSGETRGTLIGIAAVAGGVVLLWMSYSTWMEQRRRKAKKNKSRTER